jgi:hypothetical protein
MRINTNRGGRTMNKIKCNIEQSDTDSTNDVRIAFNPKTLEAYTILDITICPLDVWHKRSIWILRYSPYTVATTVEDWLSVNTEKLIEIASNYRGSKWDGSNHVGEWDDWDKVMVLAERLQRNFESDVTYIRTYTAMADWVAGDNDLNKWLEMEDREKALDDIIETALGDDIYLERGDVDAYLDHVLEKRQDEDSD